MQRLKFNTDSGNKKPAYRRKIKVNPSESAGGFSLSSRRYFAVRLRVRAGFFSYYGERIVVGNPSLPIRELLSPPCVQMMTMATKLRSQWHKNTASGKSHQNKTFHPIT